MSSNRTAITFDTFKNAVTYGDVETTKKFIVQSVGDALAYTRLVTGYLLANASFENSKQSSNVAMQAKRAEIVRLLASTPSVINYQASLARARQSVVPHAMWRAPQYAEPAECLRSRDFTSGLAVKNRSKL